jgi:Transposase DDE domain
MPKRAMDGALLEELVTLSIPVCQEAQRLNPRRGPGRKPTIPDWVLAVMILVGVLLKKKTKSAQYRWWREHKAEFARWLSGEQFPGRSTYFDRYRRAQAVFRAAIVLQGRQAVERGWADARCVAADKSLIAGRGRRWDSSDRRRGRVPRRVDTDTTWSYSQHDGWVQGYSFEVIVTAPARGVSWPLVASVDTASRAEQKTILQKIPDLPEQTRYVLADAGYDSNAVGELVEWSAGRRTGRRWLCPEVRRPNTGKVRQPHNRETRERQRRRRLRDGRRRFRQSPRGRSLYGRRKTSVEPFHSQLKRLFELEERVWHWGLPNNRTTILAAITAYQLLMMYNHTNNKPPTHLQCILDAL